MKVDLGIWGKLTWVVIVLGLIAVMDLALVKYLPLIRQNEQLRRQISSLNTQIKQEEETTWRLAAAIDAIQHDPATIERLAREKHEYAKPGETIIRFTSPASNSLSGR
jgi:cell division protein FtsB